MNLAFVGSELDWSEICPWFGAGGSHVVSIVLAEPRGSRWDRWPEPARRCDDFEELLSDPAVEAVLLAGPMERRPERLRRIAQAGGICLCAHPAALDSLAYHEAAMVAEETGAVLVPLLPGRRHPAWIQLLKLCRSETLGTVQTASIECSGLSGSGRQWCAGPYAQAADLLVSLIGRIVELTTTGDVQAGRIIVQHRSAAGPLGEVRLTRQSSGSAGWVVHAQGERGTVELKFHQGLLGTGQLRVTASGVDQRSMLEAREPGHDLIRQVIGGAGAQGDFTTWSHATVAAELAESAWLSLERRRSVDVYHEQRGELASFKGTMTSCGCGLIWLTLLGIILLASARGLGIPGLGWIPAVTVGALIVFLLLQTLRWVFPQGS